MADHYPVPDDQVKTQDEIVLMFLNDVVTAEISGLRIVITKHTLVKIEVEFTAPNDLIQFRWAFYSNGFVNKTILSQPVGKSLSYKIEEVNPTRLMIAVVRLCDKG